MAPRPRPYRGAHDTIRARVGRAVGAGGVACCRCGEPIVPGSPWHLDHLEGTVDQYRGAAHAFCNTSAAGKIGGRVRSRTSSVARGDADSRPRPAPPGPGLWAWDGHAHRWTRQSRDWLGRDCVRIP